MLRDFGVNSDSIQAATLQGIRIFCTRRYHVNSLGCLSKVSDFFDQELYDHILNVIEIFTSDAAGDEVRTASLLKGTTESTVPMDVLRNLKAAVRDRSHAATRLTKKPWMMPGRLHEVFSGYVSGRGSICRLIQNSHDNRRIFQKRLQLSKRCPISAVRWRNLSAAKHRFCSTQKPLGRLILSDTLVDFQQHINNNNNKK